MTYRGILAGLTSKQRARWERQGAAMLLKARYMLGEALAAHDEEHPITDAMDNVVHALEDLTDALSPQKPRRKT